MSEETTKGETRKKTKINEVKISDEEKQRDKLIYEMVVKRYDLETQRTNDLDAKANNITGFAGLLAAVVGGITGFLPKDQNESLFLIPLFFLVISAFLGLLAYWIKSYSAIQPVILIEEYKESSETKLLREYTYTTAQNTMRNHSVNKRKVWLIKGASVLLVLAIGLFLVVAIMNL